MIIDPVQNSQAQSQSGSQGERSPLKSTPDNNGNSGENHNPNTQPPPPYDRGAGGSRIYHNASPYTHLPRPSHQDPNPNPQILKRFVKAYIVAIVFLALWGIFVDTVGLLVEIQIGVHNKDGRKQNLTLGEKDMSVGPLGRVGKHFLSLLNDSLSQTAVVTTFPAQLRSHAPTTSDLALNPSLTAHLPSERPLPVQYPPSFWWVSPPSTS